MRNDISESAVEAVTGLAGTTIDGVKVVVTKPFEKKDG
jgi:hypothetical protein